MNILIVCSGNVPEFNYQLHQAFIYEQIEAVKKEYGIEYDTFIIKGKGVKGYLSNIKLFYQQIKKNNYDLIHAHNLPSGLFSRMQFKVPLIVTFHGSDINVNRYRKISNLLLKITSHNILVSVQQLQKLIYPTKTTIIPCGVDLDVFYPINQWDAKEKLKLNKSQKYILFGSAFDNHVKNYTLTKDALELVQNNEYQIYELKNKNRGEVNLLLNAFDMLILTSFSEGSPQIIKEAMACNCPIVATDVGDIKELIGKTEGCFITSFDPKDVADKIGKAIGFNKRTNGRSYIQHYDIKSIAGKIYEIYKKVARI